MVALQYAGASGADPTDVATKRTVDVEIANTAPNQVSVQTDINNAIANRVTREYVDAQDGRYAPASEPGIKDRARNVLKTEINAPGGPVALVNSMIPTTFLPLLGEGYVLGPYPWSAIYKVTTSAATPGTATKIGTVTTEGIPNTRPYWPMCFSTVLVNADRQGLPVVEIRKGDSPGGALLAVGRGRTMFTGHQGISVVPVGDGAWTNGTGAALTVSMWLYDLNARSVSTDVLGGAIGGGVYVLLGKGSAS